LQIFFNLVKKVLNRRGRAFKAARLLERAAAVLYNMPLSCPMN
jgi:hypothetical protein